MQAFRIHSFGLDQLAAETVDPGRPGPGQVRLGMRAVSLNYRDLLMVKGHYNPRQPLPLIPCSDGVGVIEAVGEGVALAVGTRVCPLFCQEWMAGPPRQENVRATLGGPIDGTLAQAVVLPAAGVLEVPAHLSDEEAACLPCAALTAWSAMFTQARLQPGDWVLLLGTGGVSIFGLQFAKMLGLRTVVTSSSDDKLERVRQMGADHTINYKRQPAWGKLVRDLTGGVDLVVEVGGAGTLSESLAAVRVGGQVSLIGVLDGVQQPLNVLPILMKNVRVQGILVGSKSGFESMNRAITQARLQPVIDRVFPFEEAPRAFAHLASGAHFGKVVISVGAGAGPGL
ncbi:MAG: NAD(P)-dependent alcohol dehydrogenase [Vulcanimicrobiota bacterium]